MKLKEFSDAILDLCKAYYADIDTLTAELAAANATLDRLLALMKEEAGDEPVSYTYPEDPRLLRWQTVSDLYSRACEIAGRAE